jgi:hypothetical protein
MKKMLILSIMTVMFITYTNGHADANRLMEDLIHDYNKLVRPVDSNNETLVVKFKLKLSQLLDVVYLIMITFISTFCYF